MSEKPQKSDANDYSKTLYLPQTEFPMRAGLPQREPEILKRWDEINDAVFAVVAKHAGSISAEHGIGVMKRALLPSVKDPVAYDLMCSLKRMLDPQGILNPGKVL